MKNMRTKITVTTVLAVLAIAVSACGKNQYPTPPSILPSTPTSTTTVSTGIDKFNHKWTSETTNISLTDVQRTTVAYFLRYDTAHVTDNRVICPTGTYPTGGRDSLACSMTGLLNGPHSTAPVGDCRYGYKADNGYYDIDGECFGLLDYWRDYFFNDGNSVIPKVYPAPKDPGNAVEHIKLRLGVNLDPTTEEIVTTDGAYLQVDMTTSHITSTFKFSKVTGFVVTPFGANKKVNITFQDDCGSITLRGVLVQNDITSLVISFFNTGASYKKAGCYYGGKLPNPQLGSPIVTFPDVVPESVDRDTPDLTRARLLSGHTLNDLVEEQD